MTLPPRLLLATGNQGKAGEMKQILSARLGDSSVALATLAEFPSVAEPEETGSSFEANARLKALYYARATGRLSLADDSGLVVDALGGRPGIHSARYATTPQARIARMLDELADIEAKDRTARFVCVAVLADPEGGIASRTGQVEGVIASEPAGHGGFGYDPIFCPIEADSGEGVPRSPNLLTFAQIPPEAKHALSHRGRALAELIDCIGASLAAGRVVDPESGPV